MSATAPAPTLPVTADRSRPEFRQVAEEHLDDVHRYLRHLVRDPHLAEELTAASFERALRDWRRFDPRKGRPLVWLTEVARRVALDHFRSEERRRARETRYAAREASPPPAVEGLGGIPPDLRAALARLSRAERELIALRVVLDLDVAETARLVGSSRSAVTTGVHRALAKLRAEVSPS